MAADTAEPRFDSELVRLSAPLRPRRDIEVRWAVTVALRPIVSHTYLAIPVAGGQVEAWLPESKEEHEGDTPDTRAGCHGTTLDSVVSAHAEY